MSNSKSGKGNNDNGKWKNEKEDSEPNCSESESESTIASPTSTTPTPTTNPKTNEKMQADQNVQVQNHSPRIQDNPSKRNGDLRGGQGQKVVPTPKEAQTKTSNSNTKKPKDVKKGKDKPSRILVPYEFESGVNTECIQLLRQIWNVHDEAVQFLLQIRNLLSKLRQEVRSEENLFETKFREKRPSNATSATGTATTTGGNLGATSNASNKSLGILEEESFLMHLQPFMDGLKCISDSFADIEKQFLAISVFQTQTKLVLFAKVKHAKLQVLHDRLSIIHGIHQLITAVLNLLASPSLWSPSTSSTEDDGKVAKIVLNVFQLIETYNSVLESSWSQSASAESSASVSASLQSMDSASAADNLQISQKKPSNVKVLVQIKAANRNDSALLRLALKPISGTRVIQLITQKRASYASHNFSRIVLSSFYGNIPLDKDCFEPLFTDENGGIKNLEGGFSQCPSLLGRAAVKKSVVPGENGEQKLSRTARTKMYSYFHEILWTLAGENAEDLIVWCPTLNVPVILLKLEALKALRTSLTLGQHVQDTKLSSMGSAFESVTRAVHAFTLLANWDEKMRHAFQEMYKVKRPEHISILQKPEASQWATEIGSKVGQIVTSCIEMIEEPSGGTFPPIRGAISGGGGRLPSANNEEEPLGNEAQIFFRLEASLLYFKAWVVRRAKVWLNGWAVPQFIVVSMREPALVVKLILSKQTLLLTRDFLLNHEDISIRLSAKYRKACSDDLKTALHQVQVMPDELLHAVGPVCNTLSLATLQSYMPPTNHWKGIGGLGQEKASNYVAIFIGRILEPVITASVELVPSPIQEALGKQVINAACDAWLQYILHKKIKFSEWGAVQLLRDFTAFREWIRTETELDKEALKSILQLEILKTCEGVAYLLLRNPGDVLGVGKKMNRKNRRVGPSSDSISQSATPSPARGNENDTTNDDHGNSNSAEDDIPPEMYVPNQQMWLGLRLRRGYFTPPCC